MALTKITGEGVGAVDSLTVDTNTLVVDAANNRVGIGTTSPNGNGALTVNAATDNSPQIVFTENDTAKWLVGHRHDGDHFRFYDLANSAERVRIQSGGGISFNGDTASANAMSDYEEGTFEPTFRSAAGDFTSVGYSGDTGGRYIKVGNLVYAQGCARINGTLDKSNQSSGETLVLSNLPFTQSSRSNGDNADSIANVRCPVWGSGDVPERGTMRNGENAFSLVKMANNAVSHTITVGDLPSDAMMQFTVMYTTN